MPNSDFLKRLGLSKRKYFVYNVKFVCGRQKNQFRTDCDAILSQGIYSTEINILNYGLKEVSVVKIFTPVVVHNKAIAREPETKGPDNVERVTLKPFHATMDDCCKIAKMVKDADEQLKIGFIEIVSTAPLEVYAVYTVTNIEQMQPSISVVQVAEKSLSVG